MFGEEILATIKGLGETVVSAIDQFTASPEEKMAYKLQVQQAVFDAKRAMFELEVKDRESARKREVEVKDPTTRRLAYLYTSGYFFALCALLFGWVKIPEEMVRLVDVLFGVLTAGQYSVMQYYFGSSHGSMQKDATLDRVVNHKDTK